MASSDVTFKATHCWTNLFKLIHILPPSRHEGWFVQLIVCVLLICLSCFDFACCAFDSVRAFDMLVMLWWLSELLLSTGLSPHPPIWTNSPPCLYISASVLKCTVLVIAVENHKLNQLELFQRHFLAFVEAQLANWYKLGWFGSFELLRSHLSDLLQW